MRLLSAREKYNLYNSLLALPTMLINQSILIDLRNETSVAGKMVSVDGYMNVTLEEVVFIDEKNLTYMFDEYWIPARHIRQFHIPNSCRVVSELSAYLQLITKKREIGKNKEPKMRKELMSRRNHMETLVELAQKKE